MKRGSSSNKQGCNFETPYSARSTATLYPFGSFLFDGLREIAFQPLLHESKNDCKTVVAPVRFGLKYVRFVISESVCCSRLDCFWRSPADVVCLTTNTSHVSTLESFCSFSFLMDNFSAGFKTKVSHGLTPFTQQHQTTSWLLFIQHCSPFRK